jgi:hypothetical protein
VLDKVDVLLWLTKENIHQDAKIVTKQVRAIHINLPRNISIQNISITFYSDNASEDDQSYLSCHQLYCIATCVLTSVYLGFN